MVKRKDNNIRYEEIERLEDIQASDRPTAWNIFERKNNAFATSDIHIAAFLQAMGIRCDGTMIHQYQGRDGRRSKVFMVFNRRFGTEEMRDRIRDILDTEWAGPEGQQIRLFMTEAESLKKKINDTLDLSRS